MGDVGPNEECKWEDEVKNIPPVPPTKLGGSCKNIEVKYMLSVSKTMNNFFRILVMFSVSGCLKYRTCIFILELTSSFL